MTALTIIPRDSEKVLRVPAKVSDLASFRRWIRSRHFPEKVRASYIAGEIEVDTTAEEAFSHNTPKTAVILAVGNWVEKYDLGQIFADGMLLVNEDADIANEPDLMFCRWDTLASGRAELKETKPGSGRSVELVGTPDLVVELVSRSSVTKDAVTLKERYALAGIPEYWLIDCRRSAIRFDLLGLRGNKYRLVRPDAAGKRHSRGVGCQCATNADEVAGEHVAVQIGDWVAQRRASRKKKVSGTVSQVFGRPKQARHKTVPDTFFFLCVRDLRKGKTGGEAGLHAPQSGPTRTGGEADRLEMEFRAVVRVAAQRGSADRMGRLTLEGPAQPPFAARHR